MKTTIGFTKLCFVFGLLSFSPLIKAESNTVFAIVCPDNQNVTCEDEIWDLSIYGTAYVSSYSGSQPAGDAVVDWNLNACDVGEIHRTWTVEDYNSNVHSCTQIIYVAGTGNFNQSYITWPQNTALEGCDPPSEPSDLPIESQYPTYWTPPCASVAVTYSDQLFTINNMCKKLRRTWTIIDWCQYTGSNSTDGLYTYFQDIKITQNEEPIYECIDSIFSKTHNCIDGEVIFPPLSIDPNSCGTAFTISNNSIYAIDNGADLSGTYPLGNTVVQYTIHYGCNKKKFCYVNVNVEDVSAPTPYCIAEITTALMPMDTNGDGMVDEGMVEIWAKDFDKNTSSPCGNTFTPSFSPDEVVMSKAFTCADVGENQFNVYYLSSNGNHSYCTVILDVQNNDDIPNCEAQIIEDDNLTARISGVIKSEFDAKLDDVQIECIGLERDTTYIYELDTVITNVLIDSFVNQSGVMIYAYDQETEINEIYDTLYSETREQHINFSDDIGNYSFDSLDMKKDYSISALVKDVDMTMIDKCDLEILIDHVMGVKKIENEQLLFAADIDENGKVDFDDAKHLMFYLGGIYKELPYSKASYLFPAYTTEFSHETEQLIHISNLDQDSDDANFILIRKANLCNTELESQNTPNQMNILTSFSEILPMRFRSEIQAEINRSYEPVEFTLYPNPFNRSFVINIDNPKAQKVEIEVFNGNGQKVYRRSAFLDKGFHSLDNDLENEPSGIYFYQIKAGETQFHGKIIKQ